MNNPKTVAPPAASAPCRLPPAGSCDAHSHVFGPFGEFPLREAAVYALPDAPLSAHSALRTRIGVERGILVQPAPYAHDPAAMIAAIARSKGALKGVAVADFAVTEEKLEERSAKGIVGLRFTEMRTPSGGRYPGSVGFDALPDLAPWMRKLGLHAQLWATAETLAAELPDLLHLGVPLVLDHMGCPAVQEGPNGAAFGKILALLRTENLWVKLVVCRVARDQQNFTDALPYHDLLVDAAAERCLWGSDWPYVRLSPPPDAGRMLDLFMNWVPSATLQQAILVENPARLYGFGDDE